MAKWMLGLIVAGLTACISPKNAGPQIPSIVRPQTVGTGDTLNYLVRVNFVLFDIDTQTYPKTTQAFNRAIQEWSRHIPIEYIVYIESSSTFPFMSFGPSMISTQTDIIKVNIVDIQKITNRNVAEGIVGFWLPTDKTMYLDGDTLEIDEDKAFQVCLHELGHVFGLQHIVNTNDPNATTGYIVIDNTSNAQTFVMYARYTNLNKRAKLSDLEINIAKKNILDSNQLQRSSCLHLTSY